MSWEFAPARDHFESIRTEWDALNRRGHILLDSEFVSTLLRHFGGDTVQLGMSRDSRKPGLALVTPARWGLWETFQPSQAPLGLILLRDQDEGGEGLLQLMRSLPGYSLRCAALHQDPDLSPWPVSQEHYSRLEFVDYIQTGSLKLHGTFEDYWQTRSTDLKRNNARRRRRLAEQGRRLEFVVHSEPSEVASCIREYGRLETQGWKAQGGTAVAEDNAQGRFYREVMEIFCARGEAMIFELLLDGKPIASELWIGRSGVLVNLKTTYDESLKQLSPGFLMKEALLGKLFADGRWEVLEFYGRVMDWHTKWIDRVRTLYHVNCYRHSWVRDMRNTVKRLSSSNALISPAPRVTA